METCRWKTCSKCQHWSTDDGDEYSQNPHKTTHGLCLIAKMYEDDIDSTYRAMVTKDGSMYMANLYTRHDHGCIQLKGEDQ